MNCHEQVANPSCAPFSFCSCIAAKRPLKWRISKPKVTSSGHTHYLWLMPGIYLPLVRNEAMW